MPEFLTGLSNATSTKLKALFHGSDLLHSPSTDIADTYESAQLNNPAVDAGGTPALPGAVSTTSAPVQPQPKASQTGLRALANATSTRLKAIFQRTKTATAEDDDYDELPESEWLTSDGPAAGPAMWTLPESKLTQQEKKIKKEFLTKSGPKSEPMRPNKALQGTHAKPDKYRKVRKWFLTHRFKLVTSGGSLVLVFFVWLIGHSLVAQQFVNSGIDQLSQGHANDALTSFNRAIQVDGGSASAYFNRGDAYRKKGDLKKALDDYSTSLKLSPKSVNVLDSRAALCLQMENFEQAANDYTLLLSFAPKENKPQIYNNRAAAYAGLGQYDKSLQDYRAALKVNAKDIDALTGCASCLEQLGSYAKAISEYNLVLGLDAHNYDSYLGRGYCYQKEKNFSAAAKDFQTVLKQSPHNKRALCYRADLYADQSMTGKAFEDLAAVLKMDAKYQRALMLRAVLYTNKGDYANAIKDYDQAQKVSHFKGNLALCLDRASVYRKMKEYDKAALDYTTAIALAANDYAPYLSRAQCYQQLKDYKKAVADCTMAAKLNPKSSDIYQQLGTMQEQFGNPVSAVKDYTTAISLDKKNIQPYISRGRLALAKKEFVAALADFDQALKIDSNNATALALRKQTVALPSSSSVTAVLPVSGSKAPDFSKVATADLVKNGYERLKKGSTEDAISMLCEAVRRNRNDSTARRYLGYALLSAKRPSEALEQFQALRKLGTFQPSDQQAIDKAMGASGLGQGQRPVVSHEDSFAIAQTQARIANNPSDLNARLKLVMQYNQSGLIEDALHECAVSMSLCDPNSQMYQKFAAMQTSLQGTKNRIRMEK